MPERSMRKVTLDECYVGGLYFKEHFCECILGVPKKRQKDGKPRTFNDEIEPRKHKIIATTPGNISNYVSGAVDWLVAEAIRSNKKLLSVSVGCVGRFKSLSGNPKYSIGSELDVEKRYGYTSNDPNYKNWSNYPLYYDIMDNFISKHDIAPTVRLYSDVDAAAIGEYWYSSGVDQDYFNTFMDNRNFALLKVSKSMNLGVVSGGRLVQGRIQPPISAIVPSRYRALVDGKIVLDGFEGVCDFHGNCVEGLIKEAALNRRAEIAGYASAEDALERDAMLRDLVAFYIAQTCIAICGTVAPSRIVLRGRVTGYEMGAPFVFDDVLDRVRFYFRRHMFPEGPMASRYVESSPDYPAARSPRFIVSPLPGRRKSDPFEPDKQLERPGQPGIHGVLRLAASKASSDLRRLNDVR